MECNKDDAIKAKDIAEKKLSEKDFAGSKKFSLKAHALYPGIEGLSQLIMTIDVYLSAENKINGEMDWYGVLGVTPSVDDETVKKQYRKRALMLHPDKNKRVAADGAFKLISEAWGLLSDKDKRLAYNQRRSSNGHHNSANRSSSNVRPQNPTPQANHGFVPRPPPPPQANHGFVPHPPVPPQANPTFIPRPPVPPQANSTFVPRPPIPPHANPKFVPRPPVPRQANPMFGPCPPVPPQANPTFIPRPPVQPQANPTFVPRPPVLPHANPKFVPRPPVPRQANPMFGPRPPVPPQANPKFVSRPPIPPQANTKFVPRPHVPPHANSKSVPRPRAPSQANPKFVPHPPVPPPANPKSIPHPPVPPQSNPKSVPRPPVPPPANPKSIPHPPVPPQSNPKSVPRPLVRIYIRTTCKKCNKQYEYPAIYRNETLICPHCQKWYRPTQTAPPPPSSKPLNSIPKSDQKPVTPSNQSKTPTSFPNQRYQVPPHHAFVRNPATAPNTGLEGTCDAKSQHFSFARTAPLGPAISSPSVSVKATNIAQQTSVRMKRAREEARAAGGWDKKRRVDGYVGNIPPQMAMGNKIQGRPRKCVTTQGLHFSKA